MDKQIQEQWQTEGKGSKLILANARLEARPWDVEQDVGGVEIPEKGPEAGNARRAEAETSVVIKSYLHWAFGVNRRATGSGS